MNLKDMVVPNKDFQTSINIEFDFGSKEKIEGLIPTDSVCRYLERILGDVIAPSNRRAKLLVGAYGKGKSHVVLAALMAMWCKDPGAFQRITNAYRRRNSGFAETFDRFVQDGQRLLPVVISGSTSDLRHSLLFALRNALKLCDSTDLMPSTNYDGAIRVLDRWRRDYPSTLRRYEELTGSTYGTTVAKLRALETETYEEFVASYPSLTSGSTFDVLDGADVLSVYEQVLSGLAERGVSGLYVVYDEFSKYLETSIGRATVEDTRLLQDFAEACNRSGAEKQLHLLLISHKSISNYIDADLPKEKVDGWRGVSGRFEEIEMSDDENQSYELMSSAIIKDSTKWSRWRCDHEALLSRIEGRYVHNGLFAGNMSDVVVRGCYPLHPLTAFLLPKLSEKVAQNERTLFTFLCAEGDKTMRFWRSRQSSLLLTAFTTTSNPSFARKCTRAPSIGFTSLLAHPFRASNPSPLRRASLKLLPQSTRSRNTIEWSQPRRLSSTFFATADWEQKRSTRPLRALSKETQSST